MPSCSIMFWWSWAAVHSLGGGRSAGLAGAAVDDGSGGLPAASTDTDVARATETTANGRRMFFIAVSLFPGAVRRQEDEGPGAARSAPGPTPLWPALARVAAG